jgi:uncharacterized protein YjbI with pentapeptide repeats
VAIGQLAAKQAEIERLRQGSIDETTVRIDSTRQLLEEAENDESRTYILQSFARQLRDGSPRKDPLTPFDERLASGVHESATFLGGALGKYPTKVDLSGIDLHGHYWHGAHLNDVLVRDSDLRAVDLSDASLVNAYLEDSSMECANLRGADISGAHLAGADLRSANLQELDLTSVDGLTNSQIVGASWDETTLFPASVDVDALPASDPYIDARTCARDHLLD